MPLSDELPPQASAVVAYTYTNKTGNEIDKDRVVAALEGADVYTIMEVNNLVLRRIWQFEDAKTAVEVRESLTTKNEASYTLVSIPPKEAIDAAVQSPHLDVNING